ncbi:hypothetical protein GCK72_017063 [Caenorhabditis remanei]|uniref:CHK kinase-like domain-containing protein n=1 Tax=Caenorhabditis remanei TaxID=31234 RepID=A0A6A5G6V0_CAERE|nr:hypothetical protein GCK72_017063 [Caenorhabditis remanei]KAF1750513.1 hypothetical protein GCK72_017063 [Caenorhabditis remanei]
MSLYEVSDGILETHVTWQDVESDLQKKLGTNATFGENKTAVNISDMKGFMSRIALVEPDWQNVEEGKELPQKFALKISSQLALITLSKMMNFEGGEGFGAEKLAKFSTLTRECHNREVEIYKQLIKFNHPDIPYTKVYSLKPFDDNEDLKGYMILEFIPNIHTLEMYQSIPADDLLPLVRGIATFSALAESLSPEETKLVIDRDYLELMFKEFFNETELTKKFENIRKLFEEDHPENAKKLIEAFQHYKELVPRYTKISEILGFKLVLNHGDLWQSNMIYSKNKDGELELKAMIDWQAVARMPPGLDLSRLLLGCLSVKDRRERGQELLKCYHETFKSVHGKELFSFHELQDCYNLYAPMMGMLLVPELYMFIDSVKILEEEKVAARKEARAKIVAIMEDVIEIHEQNLKNYEDFMRI